VVIRLLKCWKHRILQVAAVMVFAACATSAHAQFLRLPDDPAPVIPEAPVEQAAPVAVDAAAQAAVDPNSAVMVPQAATPADPFAYTYGDMTVDPNFDPFGTPGTQQGMLLSEDPRLPGSFQQVDLTTMTRFLQQVWFEYSYIPGNAEEEFGMNNLEINGTFAIPCKSQPMAPLLVTPGVAAHFLSGPKNNDVWPTSTPADMPAATIDAYLDAAWNPWLSQSGFISAELAARVGVYSDYKKITTDAVRVMGAGIFVMRLSPEFWLKAGVEYLDRNRIKLLPVGGLIWVPGGLENPRMRLELYFPTPKIAYRLPDDGNTIWWLYLRGEYYGNNWQIKRVNPDPAVDGMADTVDYNDIRIALGLQANTGGQTSFIFEVGIAFNRELVYRSRQPEVYRPNPMILLRAIYIF